MSTTQLTALNMSEFIPYLGGPITKKFLIGTEVLIEIP